MGELVLSMGDFNGHVGKQSEEMELERETWKERCY